MLAVQPCGEPDENYAPLSDHEPQAHQQPLFSTFNHLPTEPPDTIYKCFCVPISRHILRTRPLSGSDDYRAAK